MFNGKGITLYKPLMQPHRGKYHIRDKTKILRGYCGCTISVVNVSHTYIIYPDDNEGICKRCFSKWWQETVK
jgi:hypothetical protein